MMRVRGRLRVRPCQLGRGTLISRGECEKNAGPEHLLRKVGSIIRAAEGESLRRNRPERGQPLIWVSPRDRILADLVPNRIPCYERGMGSPGRPPGDRAGGKTGSSLPFSLAHPLVGVSSSMQVIAQRNQAGSSQLDPTVCSRALPGVPGGNIYPSRCETL